MIKLYEAPKDPKKYHIVTDEEVIHDQNKKIERLREQLNEANEVIKCALPDPIYLNAYGKKLDTFIERALKYFEKWGVK